MAEGRTALVLGAGITGVAAAERLRRAGWSVTLIDRRPPGDPEAASFGNGGILARAAIVPVPTPGILTHGLRMWLDRDAPLFLRVGYLRRLLPWLVPYLRAGREAEVRRIAAALATILPDAEDQHRDLAAGTGAERFLDRGDYVYLYRDATAFGKDRFGFGLRAEHGVSWTRLDRAALEARDPALGPAYRFGAALPDHGWVRAPGPYVAALAEHFVRQGGVVRQAEAVTVEPEGAVVLAGGERLEADRVILAAGVWSRAFAERLGHVVPMEAERGYHLELVGPSAAPPSPCFVADLKVVVTPMQDGIRLAGLAEFAGIEAPPAEAPVRLLRRAAVRMYPGLTWEKSRAWMGRRPSLTDSLPMIGASPKAPKVIFAFGGQHVGLTVGPRLGRLAAEIAQGARPNLDLAPFAPHRFDR